jgi:hypothetical protein
MLKEKCNRVKPTIASDNSSRGGVSGRGRTSAVVQRRRRKSSGFEEKGSEDSDYADRTRALIHQILNENKSSFWGDIYTQLFYFV